MSVDRPYTAFALDSSTISDSVNAPGGREKRVVKWLAVARSADEAIALVGGVVPSWHIAVTGSGNALLEKAKELGLGDGKVHKLDQ